jgi:hypothetical protein
MLSVLTPDEDSVLGEILGVDNNINQEISMERINELSKRCNMTHKRVGSALASLHDKGAVYIPLPGEADIRIVNLTCHRCRKEWREAVGRYVRTLKCPYCMKNDGKLIPAAEKEDQGFSLPRFF